MSTAPDQAKAPQGLAAYFHLLRPKQWTKGLIIFAALIFTARFTDPQSILLAVLAFVAMALVSSATYIVNDLMDVERDRAHPKKRFRPIASGAVKESVALAVAILIGIAGLAIAFWISRRCGVLLVIYLFLQVAYNLGLKRVPIADVYVIALGFVLRASLGAAAIDVRISGWLLFCTAALALMLGFAKRRNEFVIQGDDKTKSRESLAGYNLKVLDAMVILFSAAAGMSYGLYSIESQTAIEHPGLIFTSLFVVYGISRYLLLVFQADEGGEPADILLKDKHVVLTVILFIVTAGIAMRTTRVPLIESTRPLSISPAESRSNSETPR